MNLYVISQNANHDYDTFDSAVVCAESEIEARKIHPRETGVEWMAKENNFGVWAKPENVNVQYIGVADLAVPRGVVIASFNAG